MESEFRPDPLSEALGINLSKLIVNYQLLTQNDEIETGEGGSDRTMQNFT